MVNRYSKVYNFESSFFFFLSTISFGLLAEIRWSIYMSKSQPLRVSHWSLRDRKSPQVSRTLLSIKANLNKAVVWMVFTRPLFSKSCSPNTNHLVTVPSASITIGITVTFMFHCYFQFSRKVQVLISLFTFFQFHPVVSRNVKVHDSAGSLFFCWLSTGLFVGPKLDDTFVSIIPKEFYVSHFLVWTLSCANNIFLYCET